MPIEQLEPGLERIVANTQKIEELSPGLKGDVGPFEGPVYFQEGEYLAFSDITHSKRYKWAASEGVALLQEPTNQGNGMTRDLQGRLVVCEHQTRRVTRQEPDGTVIVIASSFKGTQINRPNDVVVKSDGSIYFTDPWSDLGPPRGEWDLDFSGIFRVSPDLSTITVLVRDFVLPNGLTFSPDEGVFYANDTRRQHIRAFDVNPNGILALQTDRVFCDLKGDEPGFPDGMKVDVEGNVYCTGPGGVWIIDPSGKHLGTIVHGEPGTTNMAWGGDDWKTLFITTHTRLASIRLKIAGMPVPAQRLSR